MWAIVEIGKKQYKVEKDDSISVERLSIPDGEEGSKVILDKVLLLYKNENVRIGTPYVENAKVEASILGEGKTKKVVVYKYKRREKYRRKQGHRQILTRLKISNIVES